MKKYLFLILTCILFANTAFADSPCDGLDVIIVNHTSGHLAVTRVDTYKTSWIEPINPNVVIPRETSFYSQIYAGSGSWGNAKGEIELSLENYPESVINLTYGCIKLFPQIPYIDDPGSTAEEPHLVNSHRLGSSTVFEIYGP